MEWTKQNPKARAALLSGPPGIGKTTSATLVCRHAGYEVIEMNASDKRNMAAVREHLQDSVGNTSESEEEMRHRSLSFERRKKKKVIVMDEVDGMSSGDRGGIQELIKVIKTTKTPIICICMIATVRRCERWRRIVMIFNSPNPLCLFGWER